ncbi:MAG: hypothetical protein B7Z69_06825 [Actinobacteria bacterium 21-73-9]|nr:MAG: hypothetical protein B7Z69_06825 [Actinobacteria bacterium 21-73-9]
MRRSAVTAVVRRSTTPRAASSAPSASGREPSPLLSVTKVGPRATLAWAGPGEAGPTSRRAAASDPPRRAASSSAGKTERAESSSMRPAWIPR